MLKYIDLANQCGSCEHFRKIDGTAQGECLKNPYGENVVHDPKHPYWIVSRSRAKCSWYNAPPPTNADRIRAMSDEELAEWLEWFVIATVEASGIQHDDFEDGEREKLLALLKQPAEGERL